MAAAKNREIPCNTEAEEYLLGALISDDTVIYDIVDLVRAEDFYSDINRRVFQAAYELFTEGEAIDLITIAEQLKKKNDFETVGGYSFLTSLTDGSFLSSNAARYAEIVAEKALLRKLIKAGQNIVGAAFEDEKAVSEVMEQAEKEIFDVSQNRSGKSYSPIKDVLADVYTELENSIGKGGITGIPTRLYRP